MTHPSTRVQKPSGARLARAGVALCALLVLVPQTAWADPIRFPEPTARSAWELSLSGTWGSAFDAGWGFVPTPSSGASIEAPAASGGEDASDAGGLGGLSAVQLAGALGLPASAAPTVAAALGGGGSAWGAEAGAPVLGTSGGYALADGSCGSCGEPVSCETPCGCCFVFPWWLLVPLAVLPFIFLIDDHDRKPPPPPPPIPEPGTFALVGAGLAAAILRRRRTRAH